MGQPGPPGLSGPPGWVLMGPKVGKKNTNSQTIRSGFILFYIVKNSSSLASSQHLIWNG